MTNIALALKLDPSFAKQPLKYVFMGGNYHGIGNTVPDSTAEWNFWSDPEAAHIVLAGMRSPMFGVTWEAVIGTPVHSKFLAHWKVDNKLSKFLAATVAINPNLYCDQITVALVIDPTIAIRRNLLYASVELHGTFTRGQMVISWMTEHEPWNRVTLLEEYNVTAVSRLMLDAVKNFE